MGHYTFVSMMLAPLFALALLSPPTTTLDGKAAAPLAFAKSKASVWVFVGTECPISNAYVPELNRLTQEFKTKGIRFFLVYSDPTTKNSEALAHWKSFHLVAPGLLDTKQELMKRAGASKTPEAVVLNSIGKLVYRGRIDDRWTNLGVSRSKPTVRDLHDVLAAVVTGAKIKFAFHEAVGCYIPSP